MAEQVKSKPTKAIVITAVVAGLLGATGGNLAGDVATDPKAPIDAQVEMVAYQNGIVIANFEAIGMVQKGFTPMIHAKWDTNANAKSYNVYVDGVLNNKAPIVGIGEVVRYTVFNLKAGQTYKVTVTAIGIDGMETTQSAPIETKVK